MTRKSDQIGIPAEPTWELITSPGKPLPCQAGNNLTVQLIDDHKQLFLDDDFLVETTTHVRRTMHQPLKNPANPIIHADKPWEYEFGINGGTVLKDGAVYRMWYRAGSGMPHHHTAYAESADGITWHKPTINKIEWHGSEENNLVLGTAAPGGWQVAEAKVFKDPVEIEPDPTRRYKALMGVMNNQKTPRWYGHAVAFSPDGFDWTFHPEPVIVDPTKHWGGFNTAFYDTMSRTYVAYMQRRPQLRFKYPQSPTSKRYVARMESEDFIHWTDANYLVMGPDENDPVDSDLFEPSPFQYHEAAYAYFSMALWFDRCTDTIWARLATSRDNLIWRWAGDRQPFIPLGLPGTWDAKAIHPVFTPPIVKDDEIHIYYAAYGKAGLAEAKEHGEPRPRDVGLATLRLDGFISLDAGTELARVTTWPVKFSGDVLELNVDAARVMSPEKGYGVRVEILDAYDHPIRGYHAEDCDPIHQDSVRCRVTWNGCDDVRPLEGQPVRLRFYLRYASLYAFQFKKRGSQ